MAAEVSPVICFPVIECRRGIKVLTSSGMSSVRFRKGGRKIGKTLMMNLVRFAHNSIVPLFPPGRRPNGPEANWGKAPKFFRLIGPNPILGHGVGANLTENEIPFGRWPGVAKIREIIIHFRN